MDEERKKKACFVARAGLGKVMLAWARKPVGSKKQGNARFGAGDVKARIWRRGLDICSFIGQPSGRGARHMPEALIGV